MIKQISISSILFIMFSTTVFAQVQLKLANAVYEDDELRYFTLDTSEQKQPPAAAWDVLKSALNVTNETTTFKLQKTKARENNQKQLLYQQHYKGTPVYDGYYYLHFKENVFTFANGEYNPISRVSNTVKLSESEAESIAANASSLKFSLTPVSNKAILILWPHSRENKSYKYVYKVEVIYSDALQSREIFIDAATGEVLLSVPVVCSVNIPCTSTTLYSGSQNFTGDTFAGGVRLRQVRNGVNVSTLNNQNSVNVNAIDFVNANTTWSSVGVNEGALDVHFATEQFLDYFSTVFNRNSIDNDGQAITSYTNRWGTDNFNNSIPMDNAYFNPNDITFSFGQGNVDFNSVTSLDVVAHEMAHGMAWFEVGFNNTGEARALNEGFSDIWGATIENWTGLPGKQTWLMCEEIMSNGFSSLRSLRSPATEGFLAGSLSEGNYPDTRLGPNWDVSNVAAHKNATVLGHWYFLLSEGGTGTNGLGNPFNVGGIGINTAAQIAYNTELMLTPGADFTSVRIASIAFAISEYGPHSCEVKAVTDAWYAVGVGNAFEDVLHLSVSGDNYFCATTSGNYSIPGLPTGSNVTWTALPKSGAAVANTPNATQTTFTRIANGWVTLKALVSDVCVVQPKDIYTGVPNIGVLSFSNSVNDNAVWCSTHYGNRFSHDDYPLSDITSYQSRLFSYPSMTLIGTKNYVNPDGPDPHGYVPNGWYIFELKATNACGTTDWIANEIESINCNDYYFRITASPNPAKGMVQVVISDEGAEVNALSRQTDVIIELYNLQTGTLQKRWTVRNDLSAYSLPLAGISKGVHLLTVSKGKYRQSVKVVVE